MMSGSRGGVVVHKTIKLSLKQNSVLAKSRLTDAMVRWSDKEVNLDSIYFQVELEILIKILKKIKESPDDYEELNEDVGYFIRHNSID